MLRRQSSSFSPRRLNLRRTAAFVFESLAAILGNGAPALNGQDSIPFSAGGFRRQRRRAANNFGNPRILQIHFHTFRHFKGTMEYHRTKDILHVMQVLEHKNIKNALQYVQLAEELFKDQQEYTSKVAKNEVDACALVEAGFEYVCDFNEAQIFKKRKY
jgi:integrase